MAISDFVERSRRAKPLIKGRNDTRSVQRFPLVVIPVLLRERESK